LSAERINAGRMNLVLIKKLSYETENMFGAIIMLVVGYIMW
jgi:hypothetical protein